MTANSDKRIEAPALELLLTAANFYSPGLITGSDYYKHE